MAEKEFEKSLKELEAITGKLESGSLGLDDAIEKYEQGIKAYAKCKEILEKRQKKIEKLSSDSDNTLSAEEFDVE